MIEALVEYARNEGSRVGERTGENVSALLRELGFVTASEHEELELRVAQLEHRVRLLEAAPAPTPVPPAVTLDGDGAVGDEEAQPPL